MTIFQLIINVILLCIPVIGLIAIGSACLCVFRCLMSKRKEITVIPLFSIVVMLCFIGMGILVLLGYGVANSGKNALNGFVVLAIIVLILVVLAVILTLWQMPAANRQNDDGVHTVWTAPASPDFLLVARRQTNQIGRASCRERV